jgi:dolichol-phosphate mannosyltransferase
VESGLYPIKKGDGLINISIVAPAYNEEQVIAKFVDSVTSYMRQTELSWELLIINDGSTDRTGEILSSLPISELRVISHKENLGLGKGLQTGFSHAQGDVVITMDADCTHDPENISSLYQAVLNGYDVAIASRYISGGGMVDVPGWRQVISRAGNYIIGQLLSWPVKDGTSGFRAYRREILAGLGDLKPGFEVQAEIVQKLHRLRFTEVPLQLRDRTLGKSKMRYTRLIRPYVSILIQNH